MEVSSRIRSSIRTWLTVKLSWLAHYGWHILHEPIQNYASSPLVREIQRELMPQRTSPCHCALPLRLAAKYIMPILGLSHGLEDGAKRFLDGATNPRFSSGVFYASPAGKMKGAMVDQTPIFPELASQSFQENANEAIHRFLA